MIIKDFPSGPFHTNCYVVSCPKTQRAAIIDPAPDCFDKLAPYIAEKNLQVDKILLTHSHWDHIADVCACKKAFGAEVYVHELDAGNLRQPGCDGLPCWINIEGTEPDHYFKEGDKIALGQFEFSVIETPGHTPGGVCLYAKSEGQLFSGDTLFHGSIGNISFPTSRPEAMWPSLAKLASLPPATIVYPGHGPKTTIAAESWLPRARELFSP